MQDYLLLVVALLALLVGLATGKAWERYKLVEGRWIDRRRVRQSPHFILGLNYLVSNQVDLAIDELEVFNRALSASIARARSRSTGSVASPAKWTASARPKTWKRRCAKRRASSPARTIGIVACCGRSRC